MLDAALELREAGQEEPAMHCLARAAEAAGAAGRRPLEAEARLTLAQVAYQQGLLDVAAAEAVTARALFEALGNRLSTARATRLQGTLALMRGDKAEAGERYAEALKVFAEAGDERDYINGLVDVTRVGGTEEAIPRLDEAIARARKSAHPDLEAMALHIRSDRHFSLGRFSEAIADLERAISLFQRNGPERQLGDAYVSMGRILRAHNRHEDAIAFYDRALEVQARTGDLRGQTQSLNAKAIALGYLGRAAASRAAYEQALEVARRTGSERLINFQQGNLAAAYAQEGDHARAIRLLDDVLPRETDPYILAYRHGGLAHYLNITRAHDRAAHHVAEAVKYARASENIDYLPTLLYRGAVIHAALDQPDTALTYASDAVEALERIRARLVPLDYMKRGFSEHWQAVYGVMIGLLHDRGEHARALETSELARARAFMDLLASRELAAVPGRGIVTAAGLSSAAAAAPLDAREIAATATRTDSTVLAYWVTDDQVIAWVASPTGEVRSARTPITRAELAKLAAAAVPRPGQRATAALRRLHDVLIAPVAAWLPRETALTIVPHGPLFRVSFAALRDSSGAYLVERHPLAYSPSISTLALTARRTSGQPSPGVDGRYLLVADPSPLPPAEPRLGPLPAARRETATIAALVGPRRARLLTGGRAAEASVREHLGDARVVHFATHGVIRDEEPFESYLALGRTAGGGASDGRLTVRELYDVNLDADLVVLSACSTATGAPSGDGISGLSRALFYAGTASVLATLWDVADEPSAILMSGFYRHWQRGMSKRAALRQAQVDLLRALRAGTVTVKAGPGVVPLDEQPYFWAGYILVGEP